MSDFDHLESGNEEPLGGPDGEEHLDPGHPVGGDGQQALGVEAGQHDGAPAQAVGQPAEGEAAHEEAGEVGQGENWEEVGTFAHEGPLCHDGSLVRGGVEELVASVAGNHPMGMVGGVSPHLKKKIQPWFSFRSKPDTAVRGGGREAQCQEVRAPCVGDHDVDDVEGGHDHDLDNDEVDVQQLQVPCSGDPLVKLQGARPPPGFQQDQDFAKC